MNSNYIFPLLVLLSTTLLVGWSFFKAKRFGKLGMVSWLQLVAVVSPWTIYFGLFLSGVFISFAVLLFLLVLSGISYIWLGSEIRKIALTEKPVEPIVIMPSPLITEPKEKGSNAIQPEEIKKIQGIFGIETFYATNAIAYQQGVVFQGNMRGESDAVYSYLSQALRDRLGDKYDLFLVEGQDAKPVVMVLPARPQTLTETIPQKILAGVLVIVSLFTCLALGGKLMDFELLEHPTRWAEALPLTLGIILILAVRELAWRWMGSKYQLRLGLPFFFPSSQLGAFGAFSRIQSVIPSRQALFDMAIAPAVASGLISVGMLILGLFWSGDHAGNMPIPTQIFQASVLVGSLAKLILGEALHVDLVAIHPLVILGWLGLVITALNLMPAGQLDGGRIMQAIYGRKTAGWTTTGTLLVLAIATLINPLALYWGGIILVLLRDLEPLMRNELSELDSDRDALGIFALFWMLITLLPITPVVAERLGIGG